MFVLVICPKCGNEQLEDDDNTTCLCDECDHEIEYEPSEKGESNDND